MEIAKVYKEFSKDVFRYCMFHLHNKESAEDCTSETFSRWIANKSAPNSFEELKPWLIGVARNVIREKYREISKAKLETSQVEIVDEVSVENEALNAELVEVIKQELDKLDDTTREVIILKIWEDFTFKQIAEVIEESESNTKLIYYRGLEKIKIQLGERDKGKKLYAALPLPILAGALKHLGSATEYSISTSFQAGLIQTTNLSTNLISAPQTMSILTKIKALTLPQWVGVALVTGTVVVAGAVGVVAKRQQPTIPPVIPPTSSITSSSITSTEPIRCPDGLTLYTEERIGITLCIPQTSVAEEQVLNGTPSLIIRANAAELGSRSNIDVKPFVQICLVDTDAERSCHRTGTGAGDYSSSPIEKVIDGYAFTGNEAVISLGGSNVDRYTSLSRTLGSQTIEIQWGYSSYSPGVFTELESYKQTLENIVDSIRFLDVELPSGWTFTYSSTCRVNIPTPPKDAVSDSPSTRAMWEYSENATTDSLFGEANQASISYISRSTDSGEIIGGDTGIGVTLVCGTDTTYTDETLATAMNAQYEGFTKLGMYEGCVANSETITLWKQTVNKVTIDCFSSDGSGYTSRSTGFGFVNNTIAYHVVFHDDDAIPDVKTILEELNFD